MEQSRCPDCRARLQSRLTHYPPGSIPEPGVSVSYVETWFCPNAAKHGQSVTCPNCDEQVPSAAFHYNTTPGLIGSGRYSCLSPLRFPTVMQPAPPRICDWHKPSQHRDGKPPWCRLCGADEYGVRIGTTTDGFRFEPPAMLPPVAHEQTVREYYEELRNKIDDVTARRVARYIGVSQGWDVEEWEPVQL